MRGGSVECGLRTLLRSTLFPGKDNQLRFTLECTCSGRVTCETIAAWNELSRRSNSKK